MEGALLVLHQTGRRICVSLVHITFSLVIRIECKKSMVLTGYELIYCILKCLHNIQQLLYL